MGYKIYADGACKGNPGVGGWGVFYEEKGRPYCFYGHNPECTNNQMELRAVIEALKIINDSNDGGDNYIFTDSQYVVNGVTKWLSGWKKKNWTGSSGEIKNKILWQEIDNLLSGQNVIFEWVKGHSGDYGNEKADELANLGVTGKSNSATDVKFEKRIKEDLNLELIEKASEDIELERKKEKKHLTKDQTKEIIKEKDLFSFGDVVEHKNGGRYLVLGAKGLVESSLTVSYLYVKLIDSGENKIQWCRPKVEFEDGRFKKVTPSRSEKDLVIKILKEQVKQLKEIYTIYSI